jgi:hypothetical protein
VDLNHRPLGYELAYTAQNNKLAARLASREDSKWPFHSNQRELMGSRFSTAAQTWLRQPIPMEG